MLKAVSFTPSHISDLYLPQPQSFLSTTTIHPNRKSYFVFFQLAPPHRPLSYLHRTHTMSQPTTYARPASPFFRRRPLGRAPSPPTWACYEQIHSSLDYDPDYSCSDSDSDHDDELDDDEPDAPPCDDAAHPEVHNMDVDEAGDAEKRACAAKDKGKQRAVDPAAAAKQRIGRHRERERHVRQPVVTLRPILTIQRSQGFVWNQDLFVPPYIKDRYVASTSPPSGGYISTSAASTNTIASINDYEVEVVEIRVREGELEDIIP